MPFSRETLDFLITNREMNSKEWYRENKPRLVRYVQKPFEEFIEKVLPVLQEHDPYIDCQPRIGRGISRIYRDTRFSHDKTLFRASVWCLFMRPKRLCPDIPAIYFEITPAGISYGCGYYWMDKDLLARVRDMIEEGDEFWKRALNAYGSQNVFTLDGDMYKRTRFPHLPPEERNWADRKSISVNAFSPDLETAFSPDLGERVAEDLKKILPVYDFLVEAAMSKEVAKITKDSYWR